MGSGFLEVRQEAYAAAGGAREKIWSGFFPLNLGWELELGPYDQYSWGWRLMENWDVANSGGESHIYRGATNIVALCKRRVGQNGSTRNSLVLGMGLNALVEIDFSLGPQGEGKNPDPKIPLPGSFLSPVAVFGFSQRFFAASYFGLFLQETAEASFRSIGIHLYGGICSR